MASERFDSQRSLLEYLGKNVNDRSLIQRMIQRWEVYKEDWGYYLVVGEEKKEKKSEAMQSIDDSELKELKRKFDKLMNAYKNEVKMNQIYMSMYDHLVFFYNKFLGYKKFVDWKVFWQSEYNKKVNGTQDTTETVRQWVYDRYNFEYWEVEEEECKAVDEIIAEREAELAEIPF